MQTGLASWYRGVGSKLTAAHATLPFGTQLLVTELASGRTVVVRVNDRGPFNKGRIIDLSADAAQSLGIKQDGIAQVRLEIYQAANGSAAAGSCLFAHTNES